ncbi:N-acetyl-gamma-glutamyl-phosphate reductase [Candidatus Desantisbacteria bacterium CG07_land_8_20_14_0_80_39_15]|uniref:N-acetyl-gamma-glutamyl-phosphate reductase n=1 Tax=Candidatus Desantisbacteria bacterium CG07_land_8_20_14_0_80_39_15 TaxID=1974549 RepID=A0A2M6ZHL8_9BACT|nr:MAG: N-acetyl-gamma-glutamyl-phosphate reductase [Candidatus Desantisbacteria bacterium CG07_land_8_20_14_0_80_39_15]
MIKVGIVGVTGMAGEETLKILLGHPDVEVAYLGSEHAAGSEIGDLIPDLKGICRIKCEETDPKVMAKKADVLLLCKEAGFSMGLVPELLKAGKKVIDLGPDFRLSNSEVFEKYYKIKHTAKDFLKKAVYGLPELYRDKISKANLVANPGCYPTGAILAIAPTIKEMEDAGYGLQDAGPMICISAYSGLSGSGKKYNLKTKNLFIETYGNVRPYDVNVHRHIPEIEQFIKETLKCDIKISFVPHTVPIDRGILSTIFISSPVHSANFTFEKIYEVYEKFYKDEPFVRVLGKSNTAQTQSVAHTNMCEISLPEGAEASARGAGRGQIVVISAIDNLVKGAAGQAVQSLNIMCGLDETAGLQFRSI